jgi:UDP-N-acetyl-alpha-D-quinovosamine dehydrogenase
VAGRILVTGANGFIGSALCPRLEEAGFLVRGGVRVHANLPPGGTSESKALQWVVLHDQSTKDETNQALRDVNVVVHLAARVHIMTHRVPDPLQEFRQVNLVWTKQLARVAASQGIRRFVYLSSIKVNGEQSVTPFTERDLPRPQDPYGVSKWEAEQALAHVSANLTACLSWNGAA